MKRSAENRRTEERGSEREQRSGEEKREDKKFLTIISVRSGIQTHD
jgi:hypothetical protein